MFNAELEVRLNDFLLHLSLHAEPGEVIAVIGPNGAGKTTLLRAVAGLQPLTAGQLRMGDDIWEDTATGRRVAPDERSCALVLADPLLFPHLSVTDNIAFGLRARGVRRSEARQLAQGWLERIELQGFGDRRPETLSTGQQQRVSLVRALAVTPQLLLLDEPLSAQDTSVRSALRVELRSLLDAYEGVCIFITHDPIDALTLADRVVVLEDGAAVQSGSPASLASRPATSFVAHMVGLNLLSGDGYGHQMILDGGGTLQVADPCSGSVLATFSPQSLVLTATGAQAGEAEHTPSSPRNRWLASVVEVQHVLGRVRVQLSGPPAVVAEVTPAAAAELDLHVGKQILVFLKATEIEVYDA